MAQFPALTEQAGVTTQVATPDVVTVGAGIDGPGAVAVAPVNGTSVPLGNTTVCARVSTTCTQAGDFMNVIGTVTCKDVICASAPIQSQSLTPEQQRFVFTQTVGAATVTADTVAIPAGKNAIIQVTANGRDTAGGVLQDGVLLLQNFGFKNIAGVVTAYAVQGALGSTPRDAALATAVLATNIVGVTVQVQVTGVALLTVDWSFSITVRIV